MHTKTVRANGREYTYFVTLRKTAKGRPVLVRLPAKSSPQFGATYGALLAARSRAESADLMLTVAKFIDLYEHSPHFQALADGSQYLYGIYLKKFGEGFPTAPANEIERKDVLRIADTLKPGAANSYIRTVAALYRWGRRRELVSNDPTRDIDMQDVGEHEPWPDSLLTLALKADDLAVRIGVNLMLYTAQRIGDVVGMRWPDIRNGAIHVTQQKTGKEMSIPLHSELDAELAKLPKSLGAVISDANGRPLTTRALRERIQSYAKANGHKVVPHGLRKNAVIALLECGCSTSEVAAISGQSLRLVEHYARRRDQARLGSAAILKWEDKSRTGNGLGKNMEKSR